MPHNNRHRNNPDYLGTYDLELMKRREEYLKSVEL
jgi:hypothetical protein